jgi:predicted nucleic acid-binding protein
VVLDTNIYIAAFGHPKGRNATLWAAALARRYRLLVSPAIVRELARVLASRGTRPPRAAVQVVTADPTDDRILECAVHGEADLIVSNDHHLLDLGSYGDIPIVAGPDFRRTLGLC